MKILTDKEWALKKFAEAARASGPRLDNAEGELHPSWKTWGNFFSQPHVELRGEHNGWKWYGATNCNYFVSPSGRVFAGIYGYHAGNLWEEVKEGTFEANTDKFHEEVQGILHKLDQRGEERTAGWNGEFDVSTNLDPSLSALRNSWVGRKKMSPEGEMDLTDIFDDAVAEATEKVMKGGRPERFSGLVAKYIVAMLVDSSGGDKDKYIEEIGDVAKVMAEMRDRAKPTTGAAPMTTAGFNFSKWLTKHANYEGAQGYWVAQTRAWSNCLKCKRDAGKGAQEAWQGCIDEYQKKAGSDDWLYDYASDIKDKIKVNDESLSAAASLIRREAMVFESPIPQEGDIGFGLSEAAMRLLAPYGIRLHNLRQFDSPDSRYKAVYEGIQAAKQGGLEGLAVLDKALKETFKRDEWWKKPAQPSASAQPGLSKEAQNPQAQMGSYWHMIKKRQLTGMTPGQAVMATLKDLEEAGNEIEVQASAKRPDALEGILDDLIPKA